MNHKVVIMGPTGVGKTSLAIELAQKFNAEIISSDSMQIYKGMDIGTAKPTQEERKNIPHHLMDYIEPGIRFHAAQYREDALRKMEEIEVKGKRILITGGTGMYLKSLIQGLLEEPDNLSEIREGLEKRFRLEGIEGIREELKAADPVKYGVLPVNDSRRIIHALAYFKASDGIPISSMQKEWKGEPPEDYLLIGLTRNRESLYEAINRRVDKMMEDGFLKEVQTFLEKNIPGDSTCWQAIGYKQLSSFIRGEIDLSEAVEWIKKDSRHYAKRQLTWFRRVDKIRWFDVDDNHYKGAIMDYIRHETEWILTND